MKFNKGFAHLFLILLLLALAVATILIYFKVSGKKLALPGKDQEASVGLKDQYGNPFDEKAQYVNPFSKYKNPFDNIRQ